LAKDVHELVNLLIECEAAKNRAFKFDTPMIEHYKQKTLLLKAKLVKEREHNSRLMRRHKDLHGQLQVKVSALQSKSSRIESEGSPNSSVMASRVRELRRFNQELQQEIEFVKFHLADEGVEALIVS